MSVKNNLYCAFGTPWLDHERGPLFACPGCEAESQRLAEAFRLAVAARTHNAAGYRPGEYCAPCRAVQGP